MSLVLLYSIRRNSKESGVGVRGHFAVIRCSKETQRSSITKHSDPKVRALRPSDAQPPETNRDLQEKNMVSLIW